MLVLAVILLAGAAVGVGGCTRAQDGTVLYANPVNRMLGTEETPFPPAAPAAFPQAPQPVPLYRQARGKPLRLWDVRRPVRPPVAGGPAAGELACRNVPAPGGRIRVVCD
ncbi:MAG: hypothetical protein JNL61_09325 [Rhizobiaceae bacterium]|nr:hypothetical protein [Rhizobiaceae bacterium]